MLSAGNWNVHFGSPPFNVLIPHNRSICWFSPRRQKHLDIKVRNILNNWDKIRSDWQKRDIHSILLVNSRQIKLYCDDICLRGVWLRVIEFYKWREQLVFMGRPLTSDLTLWRGQEGQMAAVPFGHPSLWPRGQWQPMGGQRTITGGGWYIGHLPHAYLKLKSRKISFIHSLFRSLPIVLKFCTVHGSDTAVLCTTFRNDWTTERDVMRKRYFARFEFKVSFVAISYIAIAPRATLTVTSKLMIPRPILLPNFHLQFKLYFLFSAKSKHRCKISSCHFRFTAHATVLAIESSGTKLQ